MAARLGAKGAWLSYVWFLPDLPISSLTLRSARSVEISMDAWVDRHVLHIWPVFKGRTHLPKRKRRNLQVLLIHTDRAGRAWQFDVLPDMRLVERAAFLGPPVR